jgi:hypothetical protein
MSTPTPPGDPAGSISPLQLLEQRERKSRRNNETIETSINPISYAESSKLWKKAEPDPTREWTS